MATIFGGSRLANLREKRLSGEEGFVKRDEPLKLDLPQPEHEKSTYEPTATGGFGRSHTRLLKGRIDRGSNIENTEIKPQNENSFNTTSENAFKLRLTSNQTQEGLKLVINDPFSKGEERKSSVDLNPMKTTQKRILIAKEPEKQKFVEKPVQKIVEAPAPIIPDVEPEKPIIFSQEDKLIREEDVEESMPQGENDLVQCPQGCGRKFNRKALEKHAKACKLVFMSKRKQFNSEAKRLVNKQQANIIKQVKTKEKMVGKAGKSKGFQKTGQNWKAASQDFRAVIKAIKKDNIDQEEKDEQCQEKEEQMKIIPCKFCEKPFAQVFLQKHLQNCAKRKQVEKKKTQKKK